MQRPHLHSKGFYNTSLYSEPIYGRPPKITSSRDGPYSRGEKVMFPALPSGATSGQQGVPSHGGFGRQSGAWSSPAAGSTGSRGSPPRKAYAPYTQASNEVNPQRQPSPEQQQQQPQQQQVASPSQHRDYQAATSAPTRHRARDDDEEATQARTQAAQAAQLPVRVLSIDAGSGPAACALPLLLLAEIERRTGQRAAKLFDLIVGTGSGAIAALALSRPGTNSSAADVANAVAEGSADVLKRSSIGGPAQGSLALEDAVRAAVGDGALRACSTNCCVTCYDVKKNQLVVLRSWDAQTANIPACLAARASASAAGLFQPVEVEGEMLSDGSVASVTPSLTAWSEARRLNPSSPNFLIVSLGCGPVEPDSTIGPLGTFVRTVANAPLSSTDRSMRVLLGGNYVRFTSEKALDHATLDEVRAEAESVATAFSGTLDSLSQRLLRNKH